MSVSLSLCPKCLILAVHLIYLIVGGCTSGGGVGHLLGLGFDAKLHVVF